MSMFGCFVVGWQITLHKKWSFTIKISSENCRFGHIYWRNLWWKVSVFMQCYTINNLHERVLGLILDNYETDFNSLLKQSNEMWNHHRNIQILMNLIFSKINLPNNLIHKHEFETKRRRAAPYGLEKIKLSRTPIFGTSTRQNQANIYNEDYVFFFAPLFYFCF